MNKFYSFSVWDVSKMKRWPKNGLGGGEFRVGEAPERLEKIDTKNLQTGQRLRFDPVLATLYPAVLLIRMTGFKRESAVSRF